MRFHSKAIEEHPEVPLADDGHWESLVASWSAGATAGAQPRDAPAAGNACYVLSVYRPEAGADAPQLPEAQLGEILGLVEARGDRVVGQQVHRLVHPDAKTLIRSGVAARIGREARQAGANMLVLDAELSPSQARNLEDVAGLPVCDREAVILNVFHRHANTPRAKAQVELAHLQYLRPRIRGIGLSMDQQAGGFVGARGAGETASELLARRIDGRIAELRQRLRCRAQADAAGRKHRSHCARVVLVGYTNAGKTSLMNALTDAGLSSRDRPFETLDTTTRALSRHGGDVTLSDTVGFIRRLPGRLMESFASTLTEVAEASLLVVVLDASDPELRTHLQTTEGVLMRLGAGAVPRLLVFNKMDRVAAPTAQGDLSAMAGAHPHVALSARDPRAVRDLRSRLVQRVRTRAQVRQVFVPYALADAAGVTNAIHARCRVRRVHACPNGTQYEVEGPRHILADIARRTRRTQR